MHFNSKNKSAQQIADTINSFGNNKILLLVSGGSVASLSIQVLEKINPEITNNLTVALIDERYGEYNHPNSNAKLLKDLGINNFTNNFIEIISPKNTDISEVSNNYAATLQNLTSSNDIIVGILGIGEDGHTAGILPGTIAVTTTNPYVIDYDTDNYKRITITPNYFKNFDVIYAYAEGQNKESILNTLESGVSELPMELIKTAKRWQIFYNKENV